MSTNAKWIIGLLVAIVIGLIVGIVIVAADNSSDTQTTGLPTITVPGDVTTVPEPPTQTETLPPPTQTTTPTETTPGGGIAPP